MDKRMLEFGFSNAYKTAYETNINGVFVYEPVSYTDNRGSFIAAYNTIPHSFMTGDEFVLSQVNISISVPNVIRGLHLQSVAAPLTKIVTCLNGSIYDVVVDLRHDSDTFGLCHGIVLTEHKFIVIPEGVAHGFYAPARQNGATVMYIQDGLYSPDDEITLHYKDAVVMPAWDMARVDFDDVSVSEKDNRGLSFDEAADLAGYCL